MSFKQMFGQVVNFAVSSIPITEAYAYKVLYTIMEHAIGSSDPAEFSSAI